MFIEDKLEKVSNQIKQVEQQLDSDIFEPETKLAIKRRLAFALVSAENAAAIPDVSIADTLLDEIFNNVQLLRLN